jgi:hypothetical protein
MFRKSIDAFQAACRAVEAAAWTEAFAADDRSRNVRKVDRRVSSRLPAVEAAAWTEAFAADDRS